MFDQFCTKNRFLAKLLIFVSIYFDQKTILCTKSVGHDSNQHFLNELTVFLLLERGTESEPFSVIQSATNIHGENASCAPNFAKHDIPSHPSMHETLVAVSKCRHRFYMDFANGHWHHYTRRFHRCRILLLTYAYSA